MNWKNLVSGKISIGLTIAAFAIVLAIGFVMTGRGFRVSKVEAVVTPTQLFYSSFIPATWSSEGWTASGNWINNNNDYKCETKQASVSGDTKGCCDYLTKMISTSGYQNIVLNFWYKIAQEIETGEYVKVQWYNGSTWTNISGATFSGPATNWKYVTFSLPSGANNNSNFGFRFAANLGSSKDEFHLDCVELTGVPICTPQTYYQDSDGDGYGNLNVSVQQCPPAPQGYVSDNTDCNDSNPNIHPGATEICNGIDDNCNGQIDEGGVCPSTAYYCDNDQDGYLSASPSGSCEGYDCVPEGCSSQQGNDCNDNDHMSYPGAQEICDEEDNNCDGNIDEGVQLTFYQDSDGDGFGNPNVQLFACSPWQGYVQNNSDCDDTKSEVNPQAQEICNGIDDNCDGQVDEGDVCEQEQPPEQPSQPSGGGGTINEYTLYVTKEGVGLVISGPAGIDCGGVCQSNFGKNSTVTLTATPQAGSSFVRWEGDCSGTDPTCTLTMNMTRSVTAIFTGAVLGEATEGEVLGEATPPTAVPTGVLGDIAITPQMIAILGLIWLAVDELKNRKKK